MSNASQGARKIIAAKRDMLCEAAVVQYRNPCAKTTDDLVRAGAAYAKALSSSPSNERL